MSSSVTIDTVCGTSKIGTGVLSAVTWSVWRTLPFTTTSSTSSSWALIKKDEINKTPIINIGDISSKNLLIILFIFILINLSESYFFSPKDFWLLKINKTAHF